MFPTTVRERVCVRARARARVCVYVCVCVCVCEREREREVVTCVPHEVARYTNYFALSGYPNHLNTCCSRGVVTGRS